MLSKKFGLVVVCGVSDLRDIHQRITGGDERAKLALEMLTHSYRHYVGAYIAQLGGLDALVFTAGIGENDPAVRAEVCRSLDGLGIALDPAKNDSLRGKAAMISSDASPVKVGWCPLMRGWP